MIENYGATGEIRTPDHLVRSQVFFLLILGAVTGFLRNSLPNQFRVYTLFNGVITSFLILFGQS